MIDLIFYYGTDIILVKINGKQVLFGNSAYGQFLAPFEKLNIDKSGVMKEFPDLKDDKDWRLKAVERFYNHIYSLETEEAISDYIIDDLRKFGYIPKYRQRKGFRVEEL